MTRSWRTSRIRQAFLIAFLVVAFPLIFVFGVVGIATFRVPSDSMIPTLSPGDFIVTKPESTYRRGEIVVIESPIDNGWFVKRIVGVGGDKIRIEGGALFINGEYASEPYTEEPINYSLTDLTVPENEVLVLGDNRNESLDASLWIIDVHTGEGRELEKPTPLGEKEGEWKRTVPVDTIIGKVVLRYLPRDRFGEIRSFPLTNVSGE